MAQLKYWIWLANLHGVSRQIKLALLEQFGDPDRIYYGEKEEYFLTPGMTRTAAENLENKNLEAADRILGDCDRLGIRVITMQDAAYPDRLKNIFEPSLLLYAQGRMPQFDDEVAVAMVGTRRASPYAIEQGERLAFQMAGLGALIVSGLAAGQGAMQRPTGVRCGRAALPPRSSAEATTSFTPERTGSCMRTSPPGA